MEDEDWIIQKIGPKFENSGEFPDGPFNTLKLFGTTLVSN